MYLKVPGSDNSTIYLSIYIGISLHIYTMYTSIFMSVCLSIYLPILQSTQQSIYLYIYFSIYQSSYLATLSIFPYQDTGSLPLFWTAASPDQTCQHPDQSSYRDRERERKRERERERERESEGPNIETSPTPNFCNKTNKQTGKRQQVTTNRQLIARQNDNWQTD